MNRGHMCSYKFASLWSWFQRLWSEYEVYLLFLTSKMRKIRPSYSRPWYSSLFLLIKLLAEMLTLIIMWELKIRKKAFESYYSFGSAITEPYKNYITTLKNLSKNVDLVITKPDKGIGVIILDKATYLSKKDIILSDESKFVQHEESKRSNIMRNQEKVYRLDKDLHKNQVIDEEMKHNLTSSSSRISIMYGSPKVHKPNAPHHSILTTINGYTYSLSLNFLWRCCLRYVKASILSVTLAFALVIYSVLKTVTILRLASILCPYPRVFQ